VCCNVLQCVTHTIFAVVEQVVEENLCVCVCVCDRERERERDYVCACARARVFVCVCACVCERRIDTERERFERVYSRTRQHV